MIPQLSMFAELITISGLEDVLNSGLMTILAPINDAFDALPDGALDALKADAEALNFILRYHVIPGLYPSKNLVDQQELVSSNGLPVTVTIGQVGSRASYSFNGVETILQDGLAANGLAYSMSAVLFPTSANSTAAPTGTVPESPSAGPPVETPTTPTTTAPSANTPGTTTSDAFVVTTAWMWYSGIAFFSLSALYYL
jgi:hypothetical protein